MFSIRGPWKEVSCPVGDECTVLNCMFNHEQSPAQRAWQNIPIHEDELEPPTKRRRLSVEPESKAPVPVSKPNSTPFVGSLVKQTQNAGPAKDSKQSFVTVPSTDRPISPPPLKKQTQTQTKDEEPIRLHPRQVGRDPAPFANRVLFLQKLHEEISRLNNLTMENNENDVKDVRMTSMQAIKYAVDEEERFARDKSSMYANAIKLRIVAYRRMKLTDWVAVRLVQMEMDGEAPLQSKNQGERSLETELDREQKLFVLRRLIARQDGLERFGYVTSRPTEDDIESAKDGKAAAQHWEKCERCRTRFQVFPERRDEDGALTTHGHCTYHSGRIVSSSTRPSHGSKDRIHSCCSELVGASSGCTTSDTHVFKVSNGAQLAAILQFETTPDNPKASEDEPVCFDCEMCYTTNGMEIVRLTATSWPSGQALLDVLVRPLGHILDLNTAYSGIRPDMLANAVPYDPTSKAIERGQQLQIAESPAAARQLLFNLLTPSTPLIGHAIENDLNATRIVHPCIVDTILLYPHEHGPLPMRKSLRVLAKQYLWRDVQTGGAAGHDSLEDARTTGDLVLYKVQKEWNNMQRQGWKLLDEAFVPPSEEDMAAEAAYYKRKRAEDEGGRELDYGNKQPYSPGR